MRPQRLPTLLAFAALALSCCQAQRGRQECVTDDGLQGVCMRENRCPNDRMALSETTTVCSGRRAKICCPRKAAGAGREECITSDGLDGVCLREARCPEDRQILSSTLTECASNGRRNTKMCCPIRNQGGTEMGGFNPDGGLLGGSNPTGGTDTGTNQAGGRGLGGFYPDGGLEGDLYSASRPQTGASRASSVGGRFSDWSIGGSDKEGTIEGGERSDPDAAWLPVPTSHVLNQAASRHNGIRTNDVTLFRGGFGGGWKTGVSSGAGSSGRVGPHRVISSGGGSFRGVGSRREGSFRHGSFRGVPHRTRPSDRCGGRCFGGGARGGGGTRGLGSARGGYDVRGGGGARGGGGGGGFNSGSTGATSQGGGFRSSEPTLSTSAVEEQVLETTSLPIVQESQECGRPTPTQVWSRRRRQASTVPAFTPFIVGGMNSEVGKWPWIAIIGFKQSGSSPFFFCGGALITSQYILTAAHCLRPRSTNVVDLVVRLGEHNTASTNDGASPVDYGVQYFTNHENFQTPVLHDDISVMKLDTLVETTALIKPICLPAGPEGDYAGSQIEVAGWGYTQTDGAASDILQEVTLTAVSVPECQSKYDTSASFQVQFPGGFGDTKLCAGEKEGGKSACRGDSGGPMVRQLGDGRYELIGVVSAGVGCGDPGFPGLYTRVSAYLDWIAANAI